MTNNESMGYYDVKSYEGLILSEEIFWSAQEDINEVVFQIYNNLV